MALRGLDFPEMANGEQFPDAVLMGATPHHVYEWYDQLKASTHRTQQWAFFWFGVVDLCGIIPCYTLWLGSELRFRSKQRNSGNGWCWIPFGAAICDVVESLTHFLANASQLAAHSLHPLVDTTGWTPSEGILRLAGHATQGKVLGLGLSLLWIVVDVLRNHLPASWSSSKAPAEKKHP